MIIHDQKYLLIQGHLKQINKRTKTKQNKTNKQTKQKQNMANNTTRKKVKNL